MSFSDLSFIFIFMPAFFALYSIIRPKGRRWMLAVGGLLFYAWGHLTDAAVLFAMSLIVWIFSLLSKKGRGWSYAGIVFCIASLVCFKYFNTPLGFPLGASFFIFHMISYLADVSRSGEPETDPVCFLAYIAMFPKLIMGPIVQYHDIAETIKAPVTTVNSTADGLFRFSAGLAKKTLIAMQLAPITESLWADAANSASSAWVGAVCFSLQLYFDFSSYSDMAIGLAQMAGFEFKENFIYPYTSYSVSEFYRRWHASLGRWFRDYVYIPLGGSRRGMPRTLINLMTVWLLTGIWHGSTLNFPAWGLFLGLVICLEKLTGLDKAGKNIFCWLLTTVLIVMSWVIFNSRDLPSALNYLGLMFGGAPAVLTLPLKTAFHDTWYVIAMAVLGSTPLVKNCCSRLFKDPQSKAAYIAKAAALCALMLLSVFMMVNSGYSAFIYTKF